MALKPPTCLRARSSDSPTSALFKPVLSAAESCSADSPLGAADSAMPRPKHRLGFSSASCQSAATVPAFQGFQTLVQVWRAGRTGPVLLGAAVLFAQHISVLGSADAARQVEIQPMRFCIKLPYVVHLLCLCAGVASSLRWTSATSSRCPRVPGEMHSGTQKSRAALSLQPW